MTSTSQGRMMSRPKSPSGEGYMLVVGQECVKQDVLISRSAH